MELANEVTVTYNGISKWSNYEI